MLQTVDEIYKVSSVALSPNVPAQIFVSEQISHVVLLYVEVDPHLSDQKYLSCFKIDYLFSDGANGQPSETWRYFI